MFTGVATMVIGKRCFSLSQKCVHFMNWQAVLTILVVCQASAQLISQVAYKDVLKSRSLYIQSTINQVLLVSEDDTFFCEHYPIHSDNSIKAVLFLWASDQETDHIQSCLYEEMKAFGRETAEALMFMSMFMWPMKSEVCMTKKFCNRSISFSGSFEKRNKLVILSLYFNDPENDGLVVQDIYEWYNKSGVPSATSWIHVRPSKNIDSHVRTFVCNSLQLSLNKTGKLRQQFFSVVGNSTETITKSSRNSSVSVILEFDVLALNAPRLGLLNNSFIEHMSLSYLHVACVKCDQYHLNDETNEIIQMNTTEELVVTPKAMITDGKLRLYTNVSIPVVLDHSFGSYSCNTYCNLTDRRNDTIHGCVQIKYFSIVFSDWRVENIVSRQAHEMCMNHTSKLVNESKEHEESVATELERIRKNVTVFTLYNSMLSDLLQMATLEVVFLKIVNYFLVIFGILMIIIIIIIIAVLVYREVRTRKMLKEFTSMESLLQSTDNTGNRNLKYDVFLSYSSKDKLWVKSMLLKFIESKGFKVCFDERDFPYGCNLVEIIGRSVYESRKVIAVVSPNYLSSRWCSQYEFVLTYTRILNKEAPSNSLLLIKYKDCQMPEHMKCLKYLDYTKATNSCDHNRSIFTKLFSYVLSLYKKIDVPETLDDKWFFDALLKWLGKPKHPERQGKKTQKSHHSKWKNSKKN